MGNKFINYLIIILFFFYFSSLFSLPFIVNFFLKIQIKNQPHHRINPTIFLIIKTMEKEKRRTKTNVLKRRENIQSVFFFNFSLGKSNSLTWKLRLLTQHHSNGPSPWVLFGYATKSVPNVFLDLCLYIYREREMRRMMCDMSTTFDGFDCLEI